MFLGIVVLIWYELDFLCLFCFFSLLGSRFLFSVFW